jgi:hypothetical protein
MARFAQNFQQLLEIDITPTGATRTYKRVGAGIETAEKTNNDEVDQKQYLDGDGYGSSDVTGKQRIINCSGDRVFGDAAQDYIAGLQSIVGDGLKTNVRYTAPDGSQFSGKCTIANIEEGAGSANEKMGFSFEIHVNGRPSEIPAVTASALTITVAAGVAVATTSFTATAGAGNTLAYRLSAASLGLFNLNQYVDGYIDYISGADIKATAGQILTAFELDANKRLVKYAEHTLISADIKA